MSLFSLPLPNIVYAVSNTIHSGSAVQQAISCLTTLPERIFHGTGGEFATFGFEYWSDPDNRDQGFVTWQADGSKTFTAPASMLAGDDATGIKARIMPEEPMVGLLLPFLPSPSSFSFFPILTLTIL